MRDEGQDLSDWFEACEEGDVQTISKLLNRGVKVDDVNEEGQTGLIVATICDATNVVNHLLKKGANLEATCEAGKTALVHAWSESKEKLLQLLIKKGANIEAQNYEGYNCLHWACMHNFSSDIVATLLKKGADVNAAAQDGRTPIMMAMGSLDADIVTLLVKKGADINTCQGEESLLMWAMDNAEDLVSVLLQKGANVDMPDEEGNTPLMKVAAEGNVDLVTSLLKRGANVDATNQDGYTALYLAATQGYDAAAELLMKKGANLNATDSDGVTILQMVCNDSNVQMVKLLLKYGVKIESEAPEEWSEGNKPALFRSIENMDSDEISILLVEAGFFLDVQWEGQTLLTYALESHDTLATLANLMIQKGANLNLANEEGNTPCMVASQYGLLDVVKDLIAREADVNAKNNEGEDALSFAMTNSHLEIVTVLLAAGVVPGESMLEWACDNDLQDIVLQMLDGGMSPDTIDREGYPLLRHQIVEGQLTYATILIEHGASVESCNEDGVTMLSLAAEEGYLDLVQLLLTKGADVNYVDENENTALYHAIKYDQAEVVTLLIEKGANVDVSFPEGDTPLMWACRTGNGDIVAMLINKDVNIKAVDSTGKTAQIVAFENEHFDIGSMLAEKGVVLGGMTDLMLAASQGQDDVVKQLLEDGANAADVDKDGKSALMWACLKGRFDVVLLLLNEDVSIDLADKEGNTALHYACKVGREDMIMKLLQYDAKIELCNAKGLNSFSVAVQYATHPVIVKMLEMNEEMYKIRDTNKTLPISLSAMGNGNKDQVAIVQELLKLDMPYEVRGSTVEEVPGHLFSFSAFLESLMPFDKQIQVIEWLFKECHFMKVARDLCYMTDSRGRININIADQNVVRHLHKYIFFCGRYDIALGPAVHCSDTAVVVQAEDYGVLDEYKEEFQKKCLKAKRKDLTEDEFSLCVEKLDITKKFSPDIYKAHFKAWDLNHDATISKDEFLKYCKSNFGLSRPVVIKFMSDEGQYIREVQARKEHDTWNPKFVVQQLKGPDSNAFQHAVEGLYLQDGSGEKGKPMCGYKFGLVMPAADRNLDAIYRQERPDMLTVSVLAKQLAECLDHVHSTKVSHCDMKLLNSVRIAGKLCLIDFDACGRMHDSFAGAKFSSGILPPEMLYCLKSEEEEEKFRTYFKHEWNNGAETTLWHKIKPKSCTTGSKTYSYVVKTFESEVLSEHAEKKVVQPRNLEDLPYKLVKMVPQLDMWSFGVVLYTLCSGKTLFPVNRDDDLTNGSSFKAMLEWENEDVANEICRYVTNARAKDLLMKLLKVNPSDRPRTMKEVLQHPFFASNETESSTSITSKQNKEILAALRAIDERTKRIETRTKNIEKSTLELKDLSVGLSHQMLQTQKVLLKGIFEATEVKSPSCFVIVPKQLDADEEEQSIVEKVDENLDKVKGYFDFMGSLSQNIQCMAGDKIKETLGEKKLYFYLVDEVTMQPVIPSGDSPYPIEITTQSEFITTMMPLVKVGFKAIRMVNGLAGIARCLGYPIPCIPSDKMDSASNFIGSLDQASSISEFEALEQQSLMVAEKMKGDDEQGDSSDCQNVRGSTLRELSKFLLANDPDDGFCGLQRVCTPEGLSCWTTMESVSAVEEQEVPLTFPDDSTAKTNAVAAPRPATKASDPPMGGVSSAQRSGGGGGGSSTAVSDKALKELRVEIKKQFEQQQQDITNHFECLAQQLGTVKDKPTSTSVAPSSSFSLFGAKKNVVIPVMSNS